MPAKSRAYQTASFRETSFGMSNNLRRTISLLDDVPSDKSDSSGVDFRRLSGKDFLAACLNRPGIAFLECVTLCARDLAVMNDICGHKYIHKYTMILILVVHLLFSKFGRRTADTAIGIWMTPGSV